MLLENIKQTCSACPSQWEAKTVNGRPVYIRYRSGWLTVQMGEVGDEVITVAKKDPLLKIKLGDNLDGHIVFNMISYFIQRIYIL